MAKASDKMLEVGSLREQTPDPDIQAPPPGASLLAAVTQRRLAVDLGPAGQL